MRMWRNWLKMPYRSVFRMCQVDEFLRWPPRVVSVVLLVLIGLTIWRTVSGWHAAKIVSTASAPSFVTTSVAVKSGDSAGRLVASHLFGIATIRAVPSSAPPLDWKVVGVVAAADPKVSVADISINDNEHLWHVGDRLPDGSTIVAIASNSVTLNRNGAVLLLPFELRPAAMDARYPTIAVAKTTNVNATRNIAAPQASPTTVRPAVKSLATLRAAALRVWAARSRHPLTH
ncbi:MAG TPA: type II secretion system protein N [Candidatus Saccharimonadales bacterium]|nr:type II secretion system protein N [Candidatus Saccharimonadales bacterium]